MISPCVKCSTWENCSFCEGLVLATYRRPQHFSLGTGCLKGRTVDVQIWMGQKDGHKIIMDWNDAVKGHWSVLPTISTQSCHHCEVFCEHTYKSNSFLVVLSLQVGWKDPKMGTMEGLRMKHWTKFYKLHVFFQGEINLQHTSCNLIWWLYIDNHMILFTYLQLMCYPHLFLPSKKKQRIDSRHFGVLSLCFSFSLAHGLQLRGRGASWVRLP